MATFLALMEGLIGDPAEKAAFAADPDNYLSANGYGDFDSEDVRTALAHTADAFPPRIAAVIDPDAGLAPVAEVDLGQLGLSSVDDYAPPLDDDVGGEDAVDGDGLAADTPDGDAPAQTELHRDVDIDLDGDGIPDAPAATAAAGGAHDVADAATASASTGDTGDDDGDGGPLDAVGDADELPTPAFATAADPFNDPFADPGLGLDDDAPWMEPSTSQSGLESIDQPDDDILDDVDEHMGQS
jgi:hypothetical protein